MKIVESGKETKEFIIDPYMFHSQVVLFDVEKQMMGVTLNFTFETSQISETRIQKFVILTFA